MGTFNKFLIVAGIFLVGCFVGSYAELQWRGLDGKTIEECATIIRNR